jgi:hypothetical protein
VQEELIRQKALQSIDDAAYTVHYVLNSLGRRPLSYLFQEDQQEDGEIRARANIYNLMYLYTKAMENTQE